MDIGVHLPLADLGQGLPSGRDLRDYTAAAAALGFDLVSANDHLVWRRPWLDGLTALAAVAGSAGDMTLATSIALPAVRHPVVLAKAIATLAVLAEGPVIAGLGPGSSAADYQAVGVPYAERWARFDEGLRLVRALVRGETPEDGRFYRVGDLRFDPLPATPPQVWFGSWGSDVRLRAMAGSADGWLASAYHTTPAHFTEARSRLDAALVAEGRDPTTYPDAIATTWTYVTHDRVEAVRLVSETLAPLLGRDPDELLAQLPIGTPEHCVQLLDPYADAGAQRMLLWPIHDPLRQLELFSAEVRPHLRPGPARARSVASDPPAS